MGLSKQYLRVGQSAKNRLFGVPPVRRGPSLREDRTPLQMLVSEQGNLNKERLAVVILGLIALALGILISTIPWVDWLIFKILVAPAVAAARALTQSNPVQQLKLWNGTLSYYYWRQPGVVRLTKVFVFNVTNPDGFLSHGEKPKLEEVGPFIYREDMEKVNVKFYDNGTASFQHKKILRFVPELSVNKDVKLMIPNIPLLTLTSKSAGFPYIVTLPLSIILNNLYKKGPFNQLTPEELLFGYEETLTQLAHGFYPKGKRPPSKMGLLIGRNKTRLKDIETIYTGHTSMHDFGLLNKLNGRDTLPYWNEAPCNSIRGSEGSLFPPRETTKEDIVHVFDKDLCRVWPLRYRGDTVKSGITVGLYTPDDNIFTSGDTYEPNRCFCQETKECPPDGLQDISPCQFGAPVFISYPHFLGLNNTEITDAVEGMNPDVEKHGSIAKIQQKLGVPLEVRIRVQLNLKVTHANLAGVRKFPSIVFPIMWLEEGAEEIPSYIIRWIYLATELSAWLVPFTGYLLISLGACILLMVFFRSYRTAVFTRENFERGKRKLRRGSSFLINGQHRLLIIRDSYTLLQNQPSTAETSMDPDP